VTRLLVEKLLLMPTEQLKGLGDADTVSAYSEALTRLFGLDDAERQPRGKVEPFRAGARRRSD
jgi:hypothetical protein